MDKINTPSGKANIQGDYAGGLIYCDCTGEFVLPDYLPEIRKIIRIDAKAIPSGKFIGSQKAEFAGIVAYTVIYAGAEGELSSTSLSSDYEFSCNLPSSSEGDFAIVADTSVDNTVCRLFGPRKLSLRSTLKSRTHVYARNKISELGGQRFWSLHRPSHLPHSDPDGGWGIVRLPGLRAIRVPSPFPPA